MHCISTQTPLRIALLVAIFLSISGVVPGFSLTLSECVHLALINNPGLQQQQLRLDIAREELIEQKSKDYGQLNLVGSYTHYNLPRTLAPLTPAAVAAGAADVPTTQDLSGAGITYEVALFTGFAQPRAVEIAKLQKQIARTTKTLNREQLIYNVRTLYMNIISLQAQEKAQTAYIKALKKIYDHVTLELSLGKKAKIDQLKAKTDLRKARTDKQQIAAKISLTRGTLASLLSIDKLQPLEKIDISPESIVPVNKKLINTLPELMRLQAAQLNVEKSSKKVEKAKAALLPQILFNASYLQNFGPNDSSNKYSGDWNNQEVWQVGLNLKWNIFDFGSNRSKIEKSRIAERQDRYEQEKTELELKRALQEAITKINIAVTEYNSTREELQLTEETEKIEQIRFSQGVTDVSDLLTAKARNQQTLSRFISAGYSYCNAGFFLDYLLERGEESAIKETTEYCVNQLPENNTIYHHHPDRSDE